MTRVVVALVVGFSLLSPGAARAQGTMFGSLSAVVGHDYEENIFARPTGTPRQSDFVTRIGPAFEGGFRSETFRWTGRYEAAGERYWQLKELNRPLARQDAAFDLGYHPSPLVTLNGNVLYVSTYSPLELGTLDAIALGRVQAERLTVRPTLAWDWGRANGAIFDYELSRESVAGLADATILTPRFVFKRKAGPRSSYRAGYRMRQFTSSALRTEASHVFAFGMEHQAARSFSLEFDAGPRFFAGTVRPEVSALLTRPLRRTEMSLGFAETTASVLGEEGLLQVRELRGAVKTQLSRGTTLKIAPTVFRDRRADRYATVQAVEVETVAELGRVVSLTVSGQFGRQQGTLSGAFERIPYYRVGTSLRLVIAGSRNRPEGEANGEPGAGSAESAESKDR